MKRYFHRWLREHRGQRVRRPHGRLGYVPVRVVYTHWGYAIEALRCGDDAVMRLHYRDIKDMVPATPTGKVLEIHE